MKVLHRRPNIYRAGYRRGKVNYAFTARRYCKARYNATAVLSVCLSVCLSVTLEILVISLKTGECIIKLVHHLRHCIRPLYHALIFWCIRNLGVFIARDRTFRCSLNYAKRSFFGAVNGLIGKLLISSFCLSAR